MQTKHMSRHDAGNEANAVLAVDFFGPNPFGPQSPWSSLLGQREHLEHEIKRGRKYLEQLRKDLTECGAFVQAWPGDDQKGGNGWMPSLAQQASANDAMEQFLVGWLERLEERLHAVTKEIAELETHGGMEPFDAKQLLRPDENVIPQPGFQVMFQFG